MKSIKVNITFPKASEVQKDLQKVLEQIKNNANIKLNLDTSSFSSSIAEMSQMIGKLKAQMSTVKGLENIIELNSIKESTKVIEQQTNAIKKQQNVLNSSQLLKTSNTKIVNLDGIDTIIKDLQTIKDEYGNIVEVVNNYNSKTGEVTSTVVKTTNEIEKQRVANEKLMASTEKVKDAMQLKLNQSLSNKNFTLIDDSVFTDLQNKINSININTPKKKINELKIAINNLNNSDSQIVRLQNAISKYEMSISNLKERYKDLVPTNELIEAESKINNLKDTLNNIQSGDIGLTNKNISNILNEASNSMKNLSSATKNASEQQRLYNKEVVTFESAFKDIATKVGLFSIVYNGINKVQNAFRDGVQSVIDMDTALTDLNKVVDLSNSQLLEMRDSAVSMGESLGRNSTQVANAMAEFGRQYKDLDTIKQMTETSILGANVMDGTSADQVAKGLTTIISAMKLETGDAIKIIDSLNEVQNNYRISADSMLEGLAEVGSVANTAGVSLQELEGWLTAVTVATGQSGSEIGGALNAIISRIYGVGTEGIDGAGRPAKALAEVGVAVRDAEGNFKNMNEILDDLNSKWSDLTQTEQIYVGQQVGGTNRFNEFMSLMQNYETAIEATATAMDSAGSATLENEKYLQSIEGRMASLKATMEGFWFNFIDSDMIKGGVSALQLLMNVLNGLQNTFGSLGLSVGTLTTAFLIFTNNPLKTFSTNVVSNEKILKGLSTELTNLVTKIKTTATATGTLNSSMTTTQKTGALLRTGFSMLGDSAVVTQVKVLALQSVLSLGLGLAISAVVGVISSFVGSLMNADEATEKVNASAKELSDTLTSVKDADVDLKNYKEINEKLKDTKLTEEERNGLNNQLIEVKEKLYSIDDKAYAILDNQNLTYQEQLDLLRAINDEKLKEKGEELDKSLGNGFWRQDEEKNAKFSAEMLERQVGIYKEAEELFKNANGDFIQLSNGATIAVKDQVDYMNSLKENILENSKTVQTYNSNVELIKKTNADTNRSTVELSGAVRSFINDLNASTDAINENTQAKGKNAQFDSSNNSNTQVSGLSDLQKAYESLGYSVDEVTDKMKELKEMSIDDANAQLVKDATTAYSEAISKTKELETILKDINEEQSLTPELIMQIASAYPEIGSRITSVVDVQEFLNEKISEQVEAQANAYNQMVANDNTYYSSKIANDNSLQESFNQLLSSFVTNSGESYATDLKNYKNLSELKADLTNKFGQTVAEFVSNFVTANADGYDIDLDNTVSWAKSKSQILQQLNKNITKIESRLSDTVSKINKIDITDDNMTDLMRQYQVNARKLAQLKTQEAEIQTEFSKYSAGFRGYTPTFKGSDFKPSSSGSGSNKGSSSSTEKEIEDLESLVKRYLLVESALKKVNNELEENRKLMESSEGADRINYLKKELQILEKKKVALQNVRKEYQEELQELKNSLSKSGFTFGSDGVIKNYEQRLEALRYWANSQSDDTKDNAKSSVENIADNIDRYMELLLDEIPDVNQELLELKNTATDVNEEIKDIQKEIQEAYKEKLDSVADVESQISDLIEKNAKERIEAEKEALEKSIENDRKRIESKKKTLQEEQDLYNKQYSEDNYEAELNEERNKLLQIQADIDKLQFANDRKSKVRLEELLAQYEEQQKTINDKIAQHQNEAINDRFEQEQKLLDKELEEKESAYDSAIEKLDNKLENFLSPQNLTNLVSGAMKSGFVNIMGETVELNDAMQEMFKDTEVGIANLNIQFNEWLDKVNSIKDVMGSLSNLMINSGITTQISPAMTRSLSSQPISIDMGGIVIEGNVDKDVLPDLDKMFKKQQDTIINIITKKLSGR